MKAKSSEIVLLKEFRNTEKEIQDNLKEILAVSLESIIPSLSTFLLGQPLFIPPITAILNPFIKGYASNRDFREFEMVVSFIDSAHPKTEGEKEKFTNKIEDDPEIIKKTIYYVSQQNDVFKSKLVGNIFKEYINNEINKEEFISILLIIDKIDWFVILNYSNTVDTILKSDEHFNYFYSSEKEKSWECLDLKWSSLKSEQFGKSKNKFLSAGLLNEEILIQPISKVIGNYSEEDQVKRLRGSSQNVQVFFNFTYEGSLLIRFGDIKNIDSKYSFS
ncbi:hypothetical protein U3A58_10160 [Algoriphagus sp. C2-6-M1]|uniref:hypothetical protein n=1 Tax=Algoriphagus persicinus TaxID=3108754 RepID=UPI002B37ECCE|nr:hypothetical protein [Algoriphagus sp. C2-6-M1]MEB2780756.1 hypothetical protein [Algoriphagus sp. C2-6-M1]